MFLISLCFISVAFWLLYWKTRLQSQTEDGLISKHLPIERRTFHKFIWGVIWILTIVSAVRHGFIDTYAYREMYRLSRDNFDYVGTGAGWGIESGWLFTCYLLNYICSSPNFILLLSALLINYAYINSIENYSEDISFSLWMYFCLSWLDTNNGLRQFAAAALTIIMLPLLLNQSNDPKKRITAYVFYCLVVFFAMQWHNSAKVCIPIMAVALGKPMNWKTWCAFLLCIAFILGLDFAKDLFVEGSGDTKYADMYLGSTAGGMGLPRAIVMGIVPLFFILLYLFKCHHEKLSISHSDGILINILLMHCAFTLLGLKIQVLSRLCFYTYFVYFLIMPKLMKSVLKEDYMSARTVAICCLTFYFWYNVYVNYLYHAIQSFYIDIEF